MCTSPISQSPSPACLRNSVKCICLFGLDGNPVRATWRQSNSLLPDLRILDLTLLFQSAAKWVAEKSIPCWVCSVWTDSSLSSITRRSGSKAAVGDNSCRSRRSTTVSSDATPAANSRGSTLATALAISPRVLAKTINTLRRTAVACDPILRLCWASPRSAWSSCISEMLSANRQRM